MHDVGEAVEEFYREHHERFYRYAYRIVRSPDKAADVVHESLTRSLPSLLCEDPALAVPVDKWPNFLFRVIHNLAVNVVTRTREIPADVADVPVTSLGDPADLIADRVDLRRCLDQLKAEERSAFLLAALEGFRLREVADLLAMSEDAAFRRVKIAERKLRRCLVGDGIDV